MQKKDLHSLSTKVLQDFSEDKNAKHYGIRVTSGTSGGPPLMTVSHYTKTSSRRFNKSRHPVILMGALNAKLTNAVFFVNSNIQSDTAILLLENKDLTSSLGQLLADFKPDSFFGSPSFLARVLGYLDDKSLILSGILYVRLSGELLTSTMAEIFKSKLPNTKVDMWYASAETGSLSAPSCSFLPMNLYHPRKSTTIEIVNTDDDDIGEILISKKISSSVELKQYAIGDIGRFISTPCPCGDPITFEILGRKDFDFIRLVGTILRQEEFDRVAAILSPYIEDYRAESRSELVDGKLVGSILLKVTPKKALLMQKSPRKFLSDTFSKHLFVTANQTLKDVIDQGFYLPLDVEFMNKKFPVRNKVVKLIYLSNS